MPAEQAYAGSTISCYTNIDGGTLHLSGSSKDGYEDEDHWYVSSPESDDIIQIVIDDEICIDEASEGLEYTFSNFRNLQSITGLSNITVSDELETVSIFGAFRSDPALQTLDLTGCTWLLKASGTGWLFENCTNLTTIYVDEGVDLSGFAGANSTDMFKGCTSLVGGSGTRCDGENYIDATYARIDADSPGYFTVKSSPPTTPTTTTTKQAETIYTGGNGSNTTKLFLIAEDADENLADNGGDDPDDDNDSDSAADRYHVLVPVAIHYVAKTNGDIVGPTDAKIMNYSSYKVHVSNIAVTGENHAIITATSPTANDQVQLWMTPGSGTQDQIGNYTGDGGAEPTVSTDWNIAAATTPGSVGADLTLNNLGGKIVGFDQLNPLQDTEIGQIEWTIKAGSAVAEVAPAMSVASFVEATSVEGQENTYSVTNGTFLVSAEHISSVEGDSQIAEGDTVTITTTPESGYVVDSIEVSPSGSGTGEVKVTRVTSNSYTFTMLDYNVDVAVKFVVSSPRNLTFSYNSMIEESLSLSGDGETGYKYTSDSGDFAIDADTIAESSSWATVTINNGDLVTITPSGFDYYDCEGFSAFGHDDLDVTNSSGTFSFIMPAYDVTLSAEMSPSYEYAQCLDNPSEDSGYEHSYMGYSLANGTSPEGRPYFSQSGNAITLRMGLAKPISLEFCYPIDVDSVWSGASTKDHSVGYYDYHYPKGMTIYPISNGTDTYTISDRSNNTELTLTVIIDDSNYQVVDNDDCFEGYATNAAILSSLVKNSERDYTLNISGGGADVVLLMDETVTSTSSHLSISTGYESYSYGDTITIAGNQIRFEAYADSTATYEATLTTASGDILLHVNVTS